MKKLLMAGLCALLFGCAGTSFDWADARKIEAGMTPEQVVQLVGKPYMVTVANGKTIYTWSAANGFTGEVRTMTVIFADGKVVSAPSIPASFN